MPITVPIPISNIVLVPIGQSAMSTLPLILRMLEPIKAEAKIPDVIMVPLLAFDKDKFRLGYGKGYYDRYLNKYIKKYKNIMTVGVAFSFQKHHKLPINQNDVKLDYILTEKGIY